MSFVTLKVAIKSEYFDRFLAIEGNGMSSFVEAGSGKVTSSKALGPLSILYMDKYNNGTIAIRAPDHLGVFLRLDPDSSNEHSFGWASRGSGIANCQHFSSNMAARGAKEIFKIVAHTDCSVLFESVCYPRAYLRMDGVGTVNSQWYGEVNLSILSWELFEIILLE